MSCDSLLSFRPEEATGHSGVSWLDLVAALKSFTSTSSPDPKEEPVQPVFSKGSLVPGKFVNRLTVGGIAGWIPPTITFPLLLIQQDLYKYKRTKGCITCITYTASLSVLLHRRCKAEHAHLLRADHSLWHWRRPAESDLAGCDAWWSW